MSSDEYAIGAEDFRPFGEWLQYVSGEQEPLAMKPRPRTVAAPVPTKRPSELNIFENQIILSMFVMIVILVFFCCYFSRAISEMKAKYEVLLQLRGVGEG